MGFSHALRALGEFLGDPVGLGVTVVVVLAAYWLVAHSGVAANVLRPVRAQDKAMQKRGIKYRELVVSTIEDLSHNVRRFTVNLEEPSATLGRHGHVSVMAHVDGQRVVRPYTPVSPPWQQGSFELVVKRYEYGTLTPHLFKLQEGDSINVRGPYGGIKYNANEHDTMLFIGAGTGLTPLLQAITIALANNDDNTRLVFAFQNRNEDDIIMREQIEEMARSTERLTVAFFLSRAPEGWEQRQPGANFGGYITAAALRRLLGSDVAGRAAVCGPPGFNKSMNDILKQELAVENVRLL